MRVNQTQWVELQARVQRLEAALTAAEILPVETLNTEALMREKAAYNEAHAGELWPNRLYKGIDGRWYDTIGGVGKPVVFTQYGFVTDPALNEGVDA